MIEGVFAQILGLALVLCLVWLGFLAFMKAFGWHRGYLKFTKWCLKHWRVVGAFIAGGAIALLATGYQP